MARLKPRDKLKIVKDNIEYEFEVAQDGGYAVSIPELPGCVSEGSTFEEAMEMIHDAMEGWLLVAAKHGDPVPPKFVALQRGLNSGEDG